METSGPMVTSPMMRQPGAIKALGSMRGVLPFMVMMETSGYWLVIIHSLIMARM
jgi:hypothetical protein